MIAVHTHRDAPPYTEGVDTGLPGGGYRPARGGYRELWIQGVDTAFEYSGHTMLYRVSWQPPDVSDAIIESLLSPADHHYCHG